MNKYLSLLRVNQWIKNLVIFIPLFFAGRILEIDSFTTTFFAFLALSCVASTTYIFNDIADRDRDKLHESKSKRLIASGLLGVPFALVIAGIITLIAGVISLVFVKSEYFMVFLLVYVLLMLVYTFIFKHIGIADAIVIALGFVLRVVAGAILLELDLSAMLVIAIIGAALLISFGKRKSEIASMGRKVAVMHRPASLIYPKGVLDSIIAALTAITFFAYILYCYSFQTIGLKELLRHYLPPRFMDPQWLLLTIPLAFYVLARYLVVIYRGDSETPEEIWTMDRGLRYGLILWGILLFLLIYFPQFSRMF